MNMITPTSRADYVIQELLLGFARLAENDSHTLKREAICLIEMARQTWLATTRYNTNVPQSDLDELCESLSIGACAPSEDLDHALSTLQAHLTNESKDVSPAIAGCQAAFVIQQLFDKFIPTEQKMALIATHEPNLKNLVRPSKYY